MNTFKISLVTGLALFAMFFGAGNIVFPLRLGVISGENVSYAYAAFLLSGVGLPYLGLYALSLYDGNYWCFFERLGKVLSFLVITFILLIIGPLFAAPRTEVVTFHTFLPLLPPALDNAYVFSFLYFSAVFMLVLRPNSVVAIVGRYISPVKIISFVSLIILAITAREIMVSSDYTVGYITKNALSLGYNTMDLLGAIFYCSVAYQHVKKKCQKIGVEDKESISKVMLHSCLIGGLLTSIIYLGFIFSAHYHAASLQGVATESLISTLSLLIFGKFGTVFVCIFVLMASIATATALADVTTDYCHETIFRRKMPRPVCLAGVLACMFMMSILGFDMIMKIASPILEFVYPAIIIYCLYAIYKVKVQGESRENLSASLAEV